MRDARFGGEDARCAKEARAVIEIHEVDVWMLLGGIARYPRNLAGPTVMYLAESELCLKPFLLVGTVLNVGTRPVLPSEGLEPSGQHAV